MVFVHFDEATEKVLFDGQQGHVLAGERAAADWENPLADPFCDALPAGTPRYVTVRLNGFATRKIYGPYIPPGYPPRNYDLNGYQQLWCHDSVEVLNGTYILDHTYLLDPNNVNYQRNPCGWVGEWSKGPSYTHGRGQWKRLVKIGTRIWSEYATPDDCLDPSRPDDASQYPVVQAWYPGVLTSALYTSIFIVVTVWADYIKAEVRLSYTCGVSETARGVFDGRSGTFDFTLTLPWQWITIPNTMYDATVGHGGCGSAIDPQSNFLPDLEVRFGRPLV